MDFRFVFISTLFLAGMISFNLGHAFVPSAKTVSFYAPAINENGKGNLIEFSMYFTRGSGRTMVNIQNAAFNSEVEDALRRARLLANNYLGISPKKIDLVLEIRGDGSTVSGESAGGMFAVAIIALHTGRSIKKDVAISAMIGDDGNLAEVGGIEEKIMAAKESNRKVFLVSKNQKIKDEGYLSEGIKIIRVANLSDAVKYLIQ